MTERIRRYDRHCHWRAALSAHYPELASLLVRVADEFGPNWIASLPASPDERVPIAATMAAIGRDTLEGVFDFIEVQRRLKPDSQDDIRLASETFRETVLTHVFEAVAFGVWLGQQQLASVRESD